jgi:hypothetical protein
LLIGVILDNNIMWLSVFFIHTVKLAYDVSKLTNNDKVPLYDNYIVSDVLFHESSTWIGISSRWKNIYEKRLPID